MNPPHLRLSRPRSSSMNSSAASSTAPSISNSPLPYPPVQQHNMKDSYNSLQTSSIHTVGDTTRPRRSMRPRKRTRTKESDDDWDGEDDQDSIIESAEEELSVDKYDLDADADDDDVASGGGKAASGRKSTVRRKIKIEYIGDKNKRNITFSKRKAGLMKKAYELSTLTGTELLLLVASETGHVYSFATPKLQRIITEDEGKGLIQSCLNPGGKNASAKGKGKAKKERGRKRELKQEEVDEIEVDEEMDCDEKIEEDSTSNENNSATRTEEPKLVAASSFSTPASVASEVDQLKTPNPSESSSVSSILLPSPPSVRRESQSSKPPINMLEQLVATETTLNGTGTKDTGLFNKPHSSNDTPTKPTVTDPRGPSQLLRSSTHNGSPLDQQIDAADLSHSEFNSNLNGPSSLFPPSLYTNVQYTSQQQQFDHNVPNSHTETQQFSQFQSLQSFQNIAQSVNSRHHRPSQDQSLTTPFDILRHVSHGTLAPHIYTLPASSTASSQSSQPAFLDAGIGGNAGTADKNHAPGSSTQLRYSSLSANGNRNNNGNDTSNMNINIDTNGINFSVQNFPQIHLSSLDPLNSLNSLNSLEYSNSLATLNSLNELSIPNLNSLLHSQCQNSNTSSQPVSNQSQVNN